MESDEFRTVRVYTKKYTSKDKDGNSVELDFHGSYCAFRDLRLCCRKFGRNGSARIFDRYGRHDFYSIQLLKNGGNRAYYGFGLCKIGRAHV